MFDTFVCTRHWMIIPRPRDEVAAG